jgi:hypothetical protein
MKKTLDGRHGISAPEEAAAAPRAAEPLEAAIAAHRLAVEALEEAARAAREPLALALESPGALAPRAPGPEPLRCGLRALLASRPTFP